MAGKAIPYNFKIFVQKVTRLKAFKLVKNLVMITGCSLLLFFILNFLFPLPDKVEYSVTVTGANGELVNAFLTSDDKWRMKTELKEISPLLRKTILAKEDKYFYYHPGVNPLAIGRAAIKNILRMKRTSGASTITMQVARALEPRRRNIFSKLIETFRAFQLEWKYSKEEILQLYLNLIPYGGNIEGVKAASLLYFKKNPDHLSLAEITALSIIPNRPSTLVIGKANEKIVMERNRWLHKFSEEGVFTSKEIDDALSEPLNASRNTVPRFIPHLSQKLRSSSRESSIHTLIELNTQFKIEKLTRDYVHALRMQNIRNASVIVIDNKTHKVVSYLGSADFKDTTDGGQVNGAAAVRQPGSTLKPLLYGLCMDAGILTPKTVINDVQVNYSGYAPENYDQKFNGFVTVEYALEHSLNIPAVRSYSMLGRERLIDKLVAVNFSQIRKDRNKLGLSLVLGGCGATLEDLTGLFSAFANEGLYVAPRFQKSDSELKKVRLLSPEASYMITDILSKVNRPDFPLNWSATERMPKIAWKTGTSYGRKDAWSIGYNKNYTVGVWVGNFSGVGVAGLSGSNTATPLLFKIFNTIDYDSNSEWYAPPEDCEVRQVCSETGLKPGPYCNNLISDLFIPLISSSTTCQHMQETKISADGKFSFCQSCAPQSGYIKKLYRSLSPEMQDYFETNGIAFEKIPAHNPDCEKIFKGDGPMITFPLNGSEYYISRENPEPLQLVAHVGLDVAKVYWYINDRFYKASNAGEKQFFLPGEGSVKISCTDDKGRNRNIRIRVSYINM